MTTITNGKYASFSTDVQKLITTASHIKVSIALDGNGDVLANDNKGVPISKRLITSMNYTYPHNDDKTGQPVLGTYKITFSDGSHFQIDDSNDGNWYLLEGCDPAVYKQLI